MPRIKWWYGLVFNLVLAALLVSGAVLYSVQKRARMTEAASDSAAAKGFRYLEVRDAVSGRLYRRWPLEEGGEFTIEFVHSVHQSPVQAGTIWRGRLFFLALSEYYVCYEERSPAAVDQFVQ